MKHTIKMTKKQSKIKKVKKAVKPKKITPAFKKKNSPLKNKNIKKKSVSSSKVKVAKSLPKVANKKLIVKKTVKSVKKSIPSKKITKPIKKVTLDKIVKKKILSPKSSIIPKKATKQEKKAVKNIETKPLVNIAPVKSIKAGKEAKSLKKEKPQKVEKFGLENGLIKPVKKSKGGRKRKNKTDDDDEPIIENDLLVEQLIQSTKRLKKPSKVPKQLRTFTNPMASLAVAKLLGNNKKGTIPKKEPKGKFELEYVMHTSPGILYEFLTSPSGLAEWFADDVNIHEGIFTFFWEGSEQKAKLLGFKDEKFVRLQWFDKPDGTYFEFRIERDDLTGDVSLIVTDFADEAADLKTSKLLWDSQINKLLHVIGSY